MSFPSSFLYELRRRNVLKAGGAYVAGGWVFYQIADALLPLVGAPDWVSRSLAILLVIGIPFVFVFAWAFEITPDGLKRTKDVDPTVSQTRQTGRKILYLIAGLLVVAVGLQIADRVDSSSAASDAGSGKAAMTIPVDLPADRQAVAVMPFRTSGPGTEVWREGLMDMLTSNLDGMGSLQAVSPRTILARIREIGASEKDLDLDQTLRTARAARASNALVGNVVSTGETVRITAEVYDTGTGTVTGRLQVEGPEEDFLSLVDRLTVQAVEAARSEQSGGRALPVPNVSALTTESLPALRAYLEGEQLWRQSRAEAAISQLEQATRLDSTFAMAHLRLSVLYSSAVMSDGTVTNQRTYQEQARDRLQAARRHGQQLPPREKALLSSQVAFQLEGDPVRATEILKTASQRFPTDPEIQWAYGGSIANPVTAWATLGPADTPASSGFRDAYLDVNRQVLALDSTYTPVYFDLTASAIARGDTADARRLIDAYRRHGGGEDNRLIESLQGAYRLAHGDSTEQEEVLQGLRTGAYIGGGGGVLGALIRNPDASSLRALEQAGDVLVERGLYSGQTLADVFGGRYQDASAFIQEATGTSPSARLYRAWAAGTLHRRGALHRTSVPENVAAPLCRMDVDVSYRTTGCFYHVLLKESVDPENATARRRAKEVLTQSETALRDEGDAEWADVAGGYRLALDGLAALRTGDPKGHAMLDRAHIKLDALLSVGGEWLPMEVQINALVEAGEPQRALPYATMIQAYDPYGHYLEGRTHEAVSNPEAARDAYQEFLDAWRDADPDIPALQHAKAVLAGESPSDAPPL